MRHKGITNTVYVWGFSFTAVLATLRPFRLWRLPAYLAIRPFPRMQYNSRHTHE
jgi:hypothetical protein